MLRGEDANSWRRGASRVVHVAMKEFLLKREGGGVTKGKRRWVSVGAGIPTYMTSYMYSRVPRGDVRGDQRPEDRGWVRGALKTHTQDGGADDHNSQRGGSKLSGYLTRHG